MNFSIRLTDYQNNPMLNICDAELLGKTISEKDLTLNINKNYYGQKVVNRQDAENLLKNSRIINMVGKETISLSIRLGIGSEKGVKEISGIPFLIVFKM